MGGARRLSEFTELTNTSELPVLRDIDASCGRLAVIWCAVKKEGEGPSVYDSYLKVSILSVLDKAPSVLPVLLFDGAADHPLAAWVRDKGGLVIVHSLSFKEKMMAAATELYRWQTTTWLATFFYFDIGLVADQLRALTAGMGVDLTNVLYTDVDTMFMGDINACSLPSPRILSAAGEVTKLNPANAGVIYLNLTAWVELHGDLMQFAKLNGWIFPNADQEWLFRFFGDRVSVLPDTYNWKPYWGHPQPGTWGKAPAIKILHIHGPKFQESVCVLKFLGTYDVTDDRNSTLLAKIKAWCKYERSQYSMQLLLDANKVDGGRMYNDAHQIFFRYLAKVRILGRPDEYWELVSGGPPKSARLA
ncbi:hypothetical protein WJX81_001463 [Elliptochloris bilobata]|uniref:Nucleotide-diphospho-sugar transferase domain-containing protein n=1 Tax=Elliptochloris bilobata TaxID=381761 RepID=A0AAW1RQB0_9CHLO